jgi:hypothetical protein
VKTTSQNILKVKLLQKETMSIPKIEKPWCEQQLKDFDYVMELLENVICCAVASTKSAQHYTMLEEAKHEFVEGFIDTCEKYRIVKQQPEQPALPDYKDSIHKKQYTQY